MTEAAAPRRAGGELDVGGRRLRCVLVLQGGGALGAYQAGVYEGLAHHDLTPHWVAGISIGAINAALIAGNPPERRVERLRQFWDRVTSLFAPLPVHPLDSPRALINRGAATLTVALGAPGFFHPRPINPFFAWPGSAGAVSWYDTSPLRATLEELVAFDLINKGATRLTVGAVNALAGDNVSFDSAERRIGPEHIMASGALPPGFHPVLIDGQPHWDCGLVSNTPLQFVLDVSLDNGRMLEQFQAMNQTGRDERIWEISPHWFVEVSPELAAERGIEDGSRLRLTSRRDSVEVAAVITDRGSGKTMFMPIHQGKDGVNALTGEHHDPDVDTPAYKELAVRVEVLRGKDGQPIPNGNFRHGPRTPRPGVPVEVKWSEADYAPPPATAPHPERF